MSESSHASFTQIARDVMLKQTETSGSLNKQMSAIKGFKTATIREFKQLTKGSVTGKLVGTS